MHSIRLTTFAAGALIFGASVAKSDTPVNNQMTWHGFFTTGAAATDSRDTYLDGPRLTQRTSLTSESRLGLNMQVAPDPKWRLAGQLLAQTVSGEDTVKADWYFATYLPFEGLKIKLGRQILPIWMISEYIDVGRAYPWVRPPQEVYALNPLKNYDGASVSYTVDISGVEITPEIIAGTFKATFPSATASKAPLSGKDLVGGVLNVSKGDVQAHALYLAGKYSSGFADPTTPGAVIPLEDFSAVFYSVGARAEIANVVLFSEYVSLKSKASANASESAAANVAAAQAAANPQNPATLKNLAFAQAFQKIIESGVIGGRGWYGTLGYQFGQVMPFATFASMKMFDDTVIFGDQKSYGGGLRYEPSLSVDVKAQWDRVNVPEGSVGLFQGLKTNASGTYDARSTNVYSLAVDYVF